MSTLSIHERIVGGILSRDLLLANVGTTHARFGLLEPDADLQTLLGAMVDAFEIALSHACLGDANGGRFPRGTTPYDLRDLEAKRAEFAAIHIVANGGEVPSGVAERFGITDEEVARAHGVAAALREVLS